MYMYMCMCMYIVHECANYHVQQKSKQGKANGGTEHVLHVFQDWENESEPAVIIVQTQLTTRYYYERSPAMSLAAH